MKLKSFEEVTEINEATPNLKDDSTVTYKIVCRDSSGTLKKLITHIKEVGNTGHTFDIVVDPDATEKEGKKTFQWDGDGSDKIESIAIETETKVKEEPKPEKEETKK